MRIDHAALSPELHALLGKYEGTLPSFVFLAEGWGGSPNCKSFVPVVGRMASQPRVAFVWTPIFVTGRLQKSRADCFRDQVAQYFDADRDITQAGTNLRLVDNELISRTLSPDQKYHIPSAGKYMCALLTRILTAAVDLADLRDLG